MSEGLFRDHIEQAVGPVRASRARKDRMREELAAHLAASLEEERARGGDEHDAARRALRRLGDSGTLSRSLDESVPWQERMLFAPIPVLGWLDELERAWSRRKHESLLHHAARLAIAMATAISIAEVIAITVVVFTTRRPTNWRVALVWGVLSPVFVAAGTFVYALLCDGMTRALERGKHGRPRAISFAVLSSAVMIAGAFGFAISASAGSGHGPLFRQSDWPRVLVMSMFAPPLVYCAGVSNMARRRARDELLVLEQ